VNDRDLPWQQPATVRQTQRLLDSFHHWLGRSLLPPESAAPNFAQQLFEAPFVVVSHGTEANPILNYGNQQALTLWEMDWWAFTQTPSRQTADLKHREARSQLLAIVQTQGYVKGYQGERVSSRGTRFWIEDGVVWTVLDEFHQPCGQAATFPHWRRIEGG
jgi:hypothetical protein